MTVTGLIKQAAAMIGTSEAAAPMADSIIVEGDDARPLTTRGGSLRSSATSRRRCPDGAIEGIGSERLFRRDIVFRRGIRTPFSG